MLFSLDLFELWKLTRTFFQTSSSLQSIYSCVCVYFSSPLGCPDDLTLLASTPPHSGAWRKQVPCHTVALDVLQSKNAVAQVIFLSYHSLPLVNLQLFLLEPWSPVYLSCFWISTLLTWNGNLRIHSQEFGDDILFCASYFSMCARNEHLLAWRAFSSPALWVGEKDGGAWNCTGDRRYRIHSKPSNQSFVRWRQIQSQGYCTWLEWRKG